MGVVGVDFLPEVPTEVSVVSYMYSCHNFQTKYLGTIHPS